MPWYLNPLILLAEFGLLGVVLGGLITAGSAYLLDERRDERRNAKEVQDRATKITTAARLIELDFRVVRSVLRGALKLKMWGRSYPLSLSGWQEFRTTIAPALSHDQWLKLVLAAEVVTSLNERYVHVPGIHGKTLIESQSTFLALNVERMEAAQKVLAPLMGKSDGGTADVVDAKREGEPTQAQPGSA